MFNESVRRRVAHFSETLSLAIRDRKMELAGVPVVFYYDTDVVLRMIMGFELASQGEPPGQSENLVRSLLSCGYLGKIEMLRPHALELAENLRRPNHYARPTDREVFKQKTREYLRHSGIEDVLAELRKIVRNPGEKEQRVEDFLSFLRDKAGDTFVAIEKVSGSWLQRLRRYYDTGAVSFERLGPEMDDLLEREGDIVHEIIKILRPERPAKYTLSIFNDAAALSILHQFISAFEEGRSKRVVRFYTETKSVRQACLGSERLRGLLSYKGSNGFNSSSVLRDSSYFVMRAWFRELSPASEDRRLDSLETLSNELVGLLSSPEENFEKALSKLELEGRQLIELIGNFERLAILDSIWIRGRTPQSLTDYFEEWTDVFAFARGEEVEQRVFTKINDITDKLESKVSRIRHWTKDFDLVLRAAEDRRRQIKGRIEEPMRDLGLVRWGYDLSEQERAELVALVGPLIQEGEDDISVQAGELATRIQQARHDTVECGVACAALWALGRFNDIVNLMDECTQGGEREPPPSLIVISAAAAMKSGKLSEPNRRELVNRVWSLKLKLPEEERKGVLLGVGYVLYHAWKQEMLGASVRHLTKENLPEEVKLWARQSFEAGEEAFYLLPTGSLTWAFAINHCAYVGMVTGVEAEKSKEFRDELIKLQGFPVWNNRFDDTLGVYYLLEAERLAANSERKRYLSDLEYLVGRADEYFERAKENDFGDIDIKEHVSRLDQVKEILRSIKLDQADVQSSPGDSSAPGVRDKQR